jgi:hypothetical protein
MANLEREGLLDVDVLAGLERHLAEREMPRTQASAMTMALDIGVAQDRVEVARERRAPAAGAPPGRASSGRGRRRI